MAGRGSRPRRRGRLDGHDPVNGTLVHASPGMADPCSRTWPGARSLSKHWFERRESRCVRYTPLSAGVTDTPAKVQDNSVAQGHTSPTGLSNPLICWRNSRWRTRSEEHTSELQSLMRISYAG